MCTSRVAARHVPFSKFQKKVYTIEVTILEFALEIHIQLPIMYSNCKYLVWDRDVYKHRVAHLCRYPATEKWLTRPRRMLH